MRNLSFYDNKSGYIAITSAILISIVLVTIVLAVSSSGMRSRSNILDSSYKSESRYTAEGCFELALLELAKDDEYAGDESFTINDNSCDILPIEDLGGDPSQKLIKTKSTVMNSETFLRIIINSEDLSIISFREEL